MKRVSLSLKAALALLGVCALFAQPVRKDAPPSQDAKMKWFRDAKFGLFIHWGLYAIPPGSGRASRSPASASGS